MRRRATFVDTSTHVPLPVTGTSCGAGTCSTASVSRRPARAAPGDGDGRRRRGWDRRAPAGAAWRGGAGARAARAASPRGRPACRDVPVPEQLRRGRAERADPAPVDPNGTTVFTAAPVLGATRTVWSFAGLASPPASQAGLTLAPAGRVNPRSYSFDMVVELSERNSAWRRLIDVQNRQSDSGFYVDPSNNLAIYPVSGSTAAFTTGDFHHIVLAVDGSTSPTTVTSYLDGVDAVQTATDLMNLDGDPVNNPQQIFNIFLDNVAAGGQGEWSTGQIGLLRLWDGVITPRKP